MAAIIPFINSAVLMANSIGPSSSSAAALDKELRTTTSSICVSGDNLTKVVDLALLLYAVSPKIFN